MTPAEIAEQLATSTAKASTSETWLDHAAESTHEALGHLAQATRGTHAPDIEQAESLLRTVIAGIQTAKATVTTAVSRIHVYRTRLIGTESPAPARPTIRPTSPARATPHEPADVTAAREELPPPVVKGSGSKTHGRWTSPDAPGIPQPIVSGRKDDLYEQTDRYLTENGMERYSIAAHVETKLAVLMAKTGLASATVIINNIPCAGDLGCDTLLPQVLPEGSTLTVHGTTTDGTHTVNTYTGKAKQ